MLPPSGAGNGENLVRKLAKSIYGQCGPTKSWRNAFKDIALASGAVESIADPATHYCAGHGSNNSSSKETRMSRGSYGGRKLPTAASCATGNKPVYGCLAVHVDDVAIFGDTSFVEQLTGKIKSRSGAGGFKENQFQ